VEAIRPTAITTISAAIITSARARQDLGTSAIEREMYSRKNLTLPG
jgi:hypothetical protein